jgi:hypothetical protein
VSFLFSSHDVFANNPGDNHIAQRSAIQLGFRELVNLLIVNNFLIYFPKKTCFICASSAISLTCELFQWDGGFLDSFCCLYHLLAFDIIKNSYNQGLAEFSDAKSCNVKGNNGFKQEIYAHRLL